MERSELVRQTDTRKRRNKVIDLQQQRDAWRHTIEGEGGHCPVCARWGRIYGRGLNETMARALIWLVSLRLRTAGSMSL